MSLPSLNQIVDEFTNQILNATSLLDNMERNPGVLYQPQIGLVFELVFLKIFIAWEQFLENSFIRYMCGASSLSGKKPKRNVSARYLDDAFRVVCGERPYADWALVDAVLERANRFFDNGEPYTTPLQSAAAHLTNMRRIRNHIVHHSNKSRMDFKKVIVDVYGFRPQGMTAGRFLRQCTGMHGEQCIREYVQTLDSLAKMIVS